MYEPLWIHPRTAAQRGIKDGDIVKAYNERGSVLCGGAINLISPSKTTSKNCTGMASSGYLVEVEKVTAAQNGKVEEPVS